MHSPIDVAGSFYLLKEDTTFINRNFEFNLSFLPGRANQLGFTTDFRSSRLTSTNQYLGAETLPPFSDFNMTYYGLEYASNTFDNYLFPRRGRLLSIGALAGQKHIIRNASLSEDLYRGLDLSTAQYKLEAAYEQFWGLGKNLVLRTRIKGGLIKGENVFLNDLFRLGGLQSLRGFNENFFYASDFLLGNFELRSVFSNNTYFMIFYDQGYIADDVTGLDEEYPFGMGAGFSLVTNAGLFNFVFALGKSSQQPLDFNFSKRG